jgi:hypothetical protein
MDTDPAHEGYVTERVQLSDWEGRDNMRRLPLETAMYREVPVLLYFLERPGP